MRLEASLQQRLVQQMRLAPQIIQSIEILQLASLDLQDLIQQELQENPVLELDERTQSSESSAESDGAFEGESEGDGGGDGEAGSAEAAVTLDGPDLSRTAEDDRVSKEFERLVELEGSEGFNELFGSQRAAPRDSGEKDRKLEAMQNSPARPASLPDYLYEQFCLRDDVDDRLRELGREIIYNLDERGFLRYGLEEIFDIAEATGAGTAPAPSGADVAEAPGDLEALIAPAADTNGHEPTAMSAATMASPASLGPAPTTPPVPIHASGRIRTSRAEAEDALRVVQRLEPRGVGARSLQECLLLQLDLTNPDYPVLQALLTRHLDDVLKNRIPKISKDLTLSIDEVNRIVAELKKLSIRPGSEYAPESSPYILPDVVVEPQEDGGYEVRLEDDYIPPLRINNHYRAMLKTAKSDPQLKEFLTKKIESARWLIDSIEQRRNTLLRVAKEIVGRQTEFLDHGISHHKPLKMQEVADELGIHVSTVSRAISGKYAQTHRGIYPLKFFFSGGTESAEGDDVSRHAVKDRVEEIVKGEDPKAPLSDDDIAAKLKDEGLSIARRTVTKYRKMLGIPSSRQRKVYE